MTRRHPTALRLRAAWRDPHERRHPRRPHSIESAVKQMQPGPLIVGVKVVNAGRAAFHVADWNFRAEPTGVSFNVLGEQMGSPTVPCDNIPAGAGRVFYIHYDAAPTLKSGADCIEGKTHRIVATVSSGGRTFTLHTYLTASEVAALAEECGGQGDVVLLVANPECASANSSAFVSRTSTSKPAESGCAAQSPRSAASSSRATPRAPPGAVRYPYRNG